MAVGKEAPTPNLCAEAAACRKALETVVAEFTEVLESVPVTTIKRRLKDAKIEMPSGFHTPVIVEAKVSETPICEVRVAVKKL